MVSLQYGNGDMNGRALNEGDRVLIVSNAGWSGRICRLDHWDVKQMRWGLYVENSSREAVRFYAARSLRKVDEEEHEDLVTGQLQRQVEEWNDLQQRYNVQDRSPGSSTAVEDPASQLERIETKIDLLAGVVRDLVVQIANLRIARANQNAP